MEIQENFFPFKNPPLSIPIIAIFLLAAFAPSISSNNFTACMPQSCGNGPKIAHPFWIINQQDSFCGLTGFNVSCKNKNPILRISDEDFVIKDIFPFNQSLLLVKEEAMYEHKACSIPEHNFSINGTPFTYSPDYADLFVFYNCSAPLKYEMVYTVDCASNATSYAFALFHPEIVEHTNNYSINLCQGLVNVPVEAEDMNVLLEMDYTDILKKGFFLQWECIGCDGSTDKQKRLKVKIGIGVAAAGLSIIAMSIIFAIYHRRYKKRYAKRYAAESSLISQNNSSYYSSSMSAGAAAAHEKTGNYFGVHIFNYNELEEATSNFDSSRELGDGGYGTVYKGKLRDGRDVAVKRLYENNYKRVNQFMNEIQILTKLRHQNLVTLYGCTSRHGRELLLVYEYIPNGTVADNLHGERSKPVFLTWDTRLKIAIETASALAYLHASDVIHRDVKTTNILLDNNFCVKVADFGLSRLFPNDVTHISTAPQGTPGYVDPEYHQCYQLTDKSDVYSFGVVLIELVSSMPAVDITRHRHEINLSTMAINKIQAHALHELVDPGLGFDSNRRVKSMILDVAELAFQCLQSGKDLRPSMEEVLETLRGIQKRDYGSEKEEGTEDDDQLLKNQAKAALSPDTVIQYWSSRSTTSNISG